VSRRDLARERAVIDKTDPVQQVIRGDTISTQPFYLNNEYSSVFRGAGWQESIWYHIQVFKGKNRSIIQLLKFHSINIEPFV
jgi:hypothetical protein